VSDEQRLIVRSALGELTGVARGWLRPLAVARSRCRMGMQAPTSICSISKDDIDLVTGMTRYSGVPVSLHPA
jgi:hypothetical protein